MFNGPDSSQDDANNDPQWSEEQLLAAAFDLAGLKIGRCEVDIMSKSTVAIFEILEKAWATQNCTLVDMKVHLRQWTRKMNKNVVLISTYLSMIIDNYPSKCLIPAWTHFVLFRSSLV